MIDHPRPLGACTRFITRCAVCKLELRVDYLPWHVHRKPEVVSHGLCEAHAAQLFDEIDRWEAGS